MLRLNYQGKIKKVLRRHGLTKYFNTQVDSIYCLDPAIRNLNAAILDRAIKDLDCHRDPIAKRSAVKWFTSDNKAYVFGFHRVCQTLGLDERQILCEVGVGGY